MAYAAAVESPSKTQLNTSALAGTVFLSAFLLFSLEPLLAKKILPWFGGSAAVWSTCLVFYQLALLVGYLYARLLTRHVPSRLQAFVHATVLVTSLALLPIGPREWWRANAMRSPSWLILGMLAATVGLPFAALSSTSPLLQDWLARSGHKTPYRLFALSNFASLGALLSYPVLIEPLFSVRSQILGWSALYVIFVILCARAAGHSRATMIPLPANLAATPASLTRKAYWLALSACGSMLLLSTTNHITKNVAPLPFLWVLPLALYLLTFILAFRGQQAYKAAVWRRWLTVALLALGFAVHNIQFSERLLLPVFLAGLFVCCYFCHGELVRLRPDAEDLTGFYLMLSCGGAVGAIFVGLVAPYLFSGIYELPLSLVLAAVLVVLLSWRESDWMSRTLRVGLACLMALVFQANVAGYHKNTVVLARNFYGALRVVQPPEAPGRQQRVFFHGTIEHGMQYLSPELRAHAATYYGPETGIGILLTQCFSGPKRVGIVGLGAGTIATFGRSGDSFEFYEIDPQVITIANTQFTFLRDSRAVVSTVEGDARLSIEQEHAPPYDVIVLDAFSGDAIPVHLLTREAVSLYLKHLKPDGVLAFHLSNQYLDLSPIVKQLADEIGYKSVLVNNRASEKDNVYASSWLLVTQDAGVLSNPAIQAGAVPIRSRAGRKPWTDESNNLFEALKFAK